jgi:hypothetical protein
MTEIRYRKPEWPLADLIGAGNGIVLRTPVDVVRGQNDPALETGRQADNLLRALIAYKQGKRK